MYLKIKSIRFDADKRLEDFIETKVNKLSRVYEDIIGAEVFLRLDKNQKMENKITEIRLAIPGGNDLFAKKQSKSFEAATDTAIEALRRQLKKHKEKLRGM
ncbi:MAG: ribosome-associated translation inhibitor RaiA [Bacteroidia bacterium]|nr:ribosome-associated translation inhibitor RaiA [Bacteroidia bacterium]